MIPPEALILVMRDIGGEFAGTAALFNRAVEEGVLYVPGDCCYPEEGPPLEKNRLRLSFGIQSCESIRRGVETLSRAIRQVS